MELPPDPHMGVLVRLEPDSNYQLHCSIMQGSVGNLSDAAS